MEPAVRIRPAEAADVEAINALYNYEIVNGVATWDEEEWPLERRMAWFRAHQADAQPVLVAEEAANGDLLGFASLTLLSDKSGYRYTRENTVIVRPGWQGKGIGRALMIALLEEARRLGLRLIVASVTSTNEASIGLHRSLGYEVMGTMNNAGFKFGAWHSTTYLQLDLGEPFGRG
jgi:phosphinothricin acetyltransferase